MSKVEAEQATSADTSSLGSASAFNLVGSPASPFIEEWTKIRKAASAEPDPLWDDGCQKPADFNGKWRFDN